jgi:hypothetical protein
MCAHFAICVIRKNRDTTLYSSYLKDIRSIIS